MPAGSRSTPRPSGVTFGPSSGPRWVLFLAIYYLAPWLRWDRGPERPEAGGAGRHGRRQALFLRHRDLAAGDLLPDRPADAGGLRPVPRHRRCSAGSGAASPARRRSGPTCSCRWSAGSRATAPSAYASTRRRGRRPNGASASLKHAAWLLIAFLTGGAWIMYFRDAPTVRGRVLHRPGRAHRLLLRRSCSPPRPTCWPAWRASRSAPTCARGRASRVRWSTRTPWRSPTSPGAASRAASTARARASTGAATASTASSAWRSARWASTSATDSSSNASAAACASTPATRSMAKIGRPPRLIAYDSERNQELRAAGEPAVYAARAAAHDPLRVPWSRASASTMLAILCLRATVDVNILPDRNPLFVTMADGSIRNGYTIRVMNKEHAAKSLRARGRRRRGPAQHGRPGRPRPRSSP